jgi:prepilin-type N-terminal cleavage/methylation domain-containing protein
MISDALNRYRQGEEGFTLIELLIVIIILGILAAIVVFSVSGITDRGSAAACKSDAATVQTASEAYYAQNGTYAPSETALQTAGFLHSIPSSSEISYAGGAVTGLTCTYP